MTSIIAVCRSKKKGTKKIPVAKITLQEDYGVVGDAHADCQTHRQVSLLAIESIEKMRVKGFDLQPGDFAENITTQGIDLASLPIGTRISLGKEVVLKMTQIGKECHAACAIRQQVGDCIMPREGIFARVIRGGHVRPGDAIKIKGNSIKNRTENKILKKVEFTRVNGGCSQVSERIVKETSFRININGQHYATAMLIATLEREFVYGNLFVQGIIHKADDIKSLSIKNNVAEVTLSGKRKKNAPPRTTSSDLKISREDVFDCVRAILKSEIFTETEAVHSAGLFLHGKEPVCIAEDLGRHHALDKVIGYGLLHDIDFSRTLAASTGRQPSEMIIKCRNAGIPIIATKGVPTTLAVAMAEEAGITIAGLVRGSTMTVYSHPARIEGCDEE